MKRLVVLGAGTAGTAVANRLRAAIPDYDLAITVIDQDDAHHYQPGYLFAAFGYYSRRQIVRPRHRLLAAGIELVLTAIDHVDPGAREVTLADGRRIGYDILIIATGVTPRLDRVTGMDGPQVGQTVHEFYTLEGAERLHEALRHFAGGRLVVHISEMPIKCPVAPLEFTFLADAWLRDHGLREATTVTFVTPLDGAFTKPVAARELGNLLTTRDIDVVTDFNIESVDAETREIVSYDGRKVGYDLLVTIPPNMGADYIERSGIGDDLNLVPCDPHTMASIDFDNVWVLGDAGTLPTSKAGAVAHFSIDIFMENFMTAWRGGEPDREFDGHANCFVETGHGQAMLLDFNYDTQPLTGVFPLPVVGPLRLLRESRLNHLGKLGFAYIYWYMLLPGRRIPLPADMTKAGKDLEGEPDGSPLTRLAAVMKRGRRSPSPMSEPPLDAGSAEAAPAAPDADPGTGPDQAAIAAPIIPTF